MVDEISLTDQLLIAMPNLADPNFHHSVSYICEHNEEGAMGVIINRPTELTLSDLCDQLEIPVKNENAGELPIFHGGPVEPERGFVLHTPLGNWESTMPITSQIGLTMSQDIIKAIVTDDHQPDDFIVMLGYAGWGESQIEQEISQNAWLNAPASTDIIFHTPIEKRWSTAADSIGIDLGQISTDVGHA